MTEAATAVKLEAVDIMQIMKVLPHRYPFLLVDRIVDIHGDESGVGIKNVTINEPIFTGHFPAAPVYPGVLIIEGMAQTAGAMGMLTLGYEKPTKVYFLTIDKAKFRKPVIPGDTMEYHLQKINRRKMMWWYKGVAKVRGEIVAEAEIGAMLTD